MSPSSWRRVEGPKQPFVRAVMFVKAPMKLAGCLECNGTNRCAAQKMAFMEMRQRWRVVPVCNTGALAGLVGSNPAISTKITGHQDPLTSSQNASMSEARDPDGKNSECSVVEARRPSMPEGQFESGAPFYPFVA